MASLVSRVGQILPEGNLKNYLRLFGFKIIFATFGVKRVLLGTYHDQTPARIARLVFTRESLGTRENTGYLQHYRLQAGDIVVNAGSYHGYFAIYAATKVGPAGRVICFEPEPNNRRLLLRNIQLNSLSNITVIPYGLWSTNTHLPLISMGSGSRLQPNSAWHKQTIPVTTLDSVLAKLNLPNLNLLTMDIEGAEIEALKGARDTITRFPALNIAIASYHQINGGPSYPLVEALLRQYGLAAFTAYPRHLTTYGCHQHAYRHHIPKSDLEPRKNCVWRSLGARTILRRISRYGDKLSRERQARHNFNRLWSPMVGCDVYSSWRQFWRVLRHEHPLFIFSLVRNTTIWATHKYLLRHRWLLKKIHHYQMLFDLSDPGISRSLLLVGDREREHRFILSLAIRPGDTILDLGANIGYYVLMEHQLMKHTGHVIAVEPEPNNFELLKRNIDLNHCADRTTTINAAVSDQNGTAPLFLSRLGNVHSLKQHQTSRYTGRSVQVKTISLSTIAARFPAINLMRMDIEGYEQEILQALLNINAHKKWQPKILFELHPPKYNRRLFNRLLSDLYTLGYRATYLATSNLPLLRRHQLRCLKALPTDGTIRYITCQVPLPALLDLYPRSRAVLLEHS